MIAMNLNIYEKLNETATALNKRQATFWLKMYEKVYIWYIKTLKNCLDIYENIPYSLSYESNRYNC